MKNHLKSNKHQIYLQRLNNHHNDILTKVGELKETEIYLRRENNKLRNIIDKQNLLIQDLNSVIQKISNSNNLD